MNRNLCILRRYLATSLVTVLATAVLSSAVRADIRIKNNRFNKICRLVAVVDSHRGSRVVHDGPVRRGERKTFRSVGSVLCIQRSVVPERCNSGLTEPVCKVDTHSNRTVLWTIQ